MVALREPLVVESDVSEGFVSDLDVEICIHSSDQTPVLSSGVPRVFAFRKVSKI